MPDYPAHAMTYFQESLMGKKSKNAPQADRIYSGLQDILQEEEYHESIQKRERSLEQRKTEQYFDQLLSLRLQDGDPYLRKLTRMSTQELEDEYFELTKRLPEPEIETIIKHFDSGLIKGKRTVRIIKQSREYYMINMIRAELRRRQRSIAQPAAFCVEATQTVQASTEPQRGDMNDATSVVLPGDRNDAGSRRDNRPTQAEHDNLKADHLATTRALVRLKKRLKADQFTEAQLRDLVESNRKKNGTINYLKVSKSMGVHHSTAKRRLDALGIR